MDDNDVSIVHGVPDCACCIRVVPLSTAGHKTRGADGDLQVDPTAALQARHQTPNPRSHLFCSATWTARQVPHKEIIEPDKGIIGPEHPQIKGAWAQGPWVL